MSSFNTNAAKKDGLQDQCKPCHAAIKKVYDKRFRSDRGRLYKKRLKACKVHPECTTIDREVVLALGHGLCGICGKRVRKRWHMDHIIPVSKGGVHCYKNLQPSHIRCNLRKGNKVAL